MRRPPPDTEKWPRIHHGEAARPPRPASQVTRGGIDPAGEAVGGAVLAGPRVTLQLRLAATGGTIRGLADP